MHAEFAYLLLLKNKTQKAKQLVFQLAESAMSLTTMRHISSVQFSRSVVSNFLWPHGLQHTRLEAY